MTFYNCRKFSRGVPESFIGPQDEGSDMNFLDACRAIFVNYKERKCGTR